MLLPPDNCENCDKLHDLDGDLCIDCTLEKVHNKYRKKSRRKPKDVVKQCIICRKTVRLRNKVCPPCRIALRGIICRFCGWAVENNNILCNKCQKDGRIRQSEYREDHRKRGLCTECNDLPIYPYNTCEKHLREVKRK